MGLNDTTHSIAETEACNSKYSTNTARQNDHDHDKLLFEIKSFLKNN